MTTLEKRAHSRRDSDRHLEENERHLRAINEDLTAQTADGSNRFLEAVFSTAPIGMGFVDRNLRYVQVNDALAAMNVRSCEEHIKTLFREGDPNFAPVV